MRSTIRLLVLPIAICATANAMFLIVPAPAAARAGSETMVTMISESGDYIGGGQDRFYYPGNGSVGVQGNGGEVSFAVSGGNLGQDFTLEFAAPPNESLAPGTYRNAQRASFREAGRPGIDISGDGRGCNEVTGSFVVKRIETDSSGAVTSAWIVYEQHCEGGIAALTGEVRYQVPGDGGDALVGPRDLHWRAVGVKERPIVAPVTVINPGTDPFTISDARISGADADDYSIRLNECAGKKLAADAVCNIWIKVVPKGTGKRSAKLTFEESSGTVHAVRLSIFVIPGRTDLKMSSDHGDYIGGGADYRYTLANANIGFSGDRHFVQMGISSDKGDSWSLEFQAPSDDILAPHSTYKATRYPFNDAGAGMNIDGDGRGCNQLSGTFTVDDIATNSSGEVTHAKIEFEQHCEKKKPALHGVLEYRIR